MGWHGASDALPTLHLITLHDDDDIDDDVDIDDDIDDDDDDASESQNPPLYKNESDPEELLQFQSFEETGTLPSSAPLPAQQASGGFWTVDYYKKYFDINTTDVVERMTAAVYPVRDFFAIVSVNPDLYGPFWIPTTVIFLLFACKIISQYVSTSLSGSAYTFNISDLSWAFSAVYGFVTVIPAISWAICRYYHLSLSLLQLIDLYGYGVSIWVPVAILSIISNEIFRYVLVGLAFGLSVLFKYKNIQPVAMAANSKSALAVQSGFIIVSQGGLAFLFKRYIQNSEQQSSRT